MDEKAEKSVVAKLKVPHTKNKRGRVYLGIFDARDSSLIPLQLILFVLASIEAGQGIFDIVRPSHDLQPHIYAHLGAYTLAYASALFVISFRPARARGLLVIVSVAAFCFVSTSVLDLVRGRADLAGEVQHVTKLIPPFIVWVIASRVIAFSKPRQKSKE